MGGSAGLPVNSPRVAGPKCTKKQIFSPFALVPKKSNSGIEKPIVSIGPPPSPIAPIPPLTPVISGN